MNTIEQFMQDVMERLNRTEILIRTNNLLLSRFILELATLQKKFHIPKSLTFFKFEITKEEYDKLCKEFKKTEVDKALFYLDRLLLKNKQQCPNNITRYVRTKLKNKHNKTHSVRVDNKEEVNEDDDT